MLVDTLRLNLSLWRLILSKIYFRASIFLLALLLSFNVSNAPKIEKPDILPKIQIWAQKQKYLIPDENDLHMAIKAGIQNKIDPYLILAVIGVESSFRSTAKSNADGHGYMQVVPKWHKFVDKSKLLDPQYNIDVGSIILSKYISRAGSIERGLQMYNGSVGSNKYSNKVLQSYTNLIKEIS